MFGKTPSEDARRVLGIVPLYNDDFEMGEKGKVCALNVNKNRTFVDKNSTKVELGGFEPPTF
jgi:hypothetical protein